MTLRGLHEHLEDEGIKIAFSSLSELLSVEGVYEMLGVTGNGAGRIFSDDAVATVARFIPWYRDMKGKKPQAAQLLRTFLAQKPSDLDTDLLAKVDDGSDERPLPTKLSFPTKQNLSAEALALMAREIGLAQGDELLTRKEAMAFVRLGSTAFRKHGPPPSSTWGASPRWLKSDLLKHGTG